MHACEECGGEMRPERGDYPDPDLPGVVLVGIEMPRCATCGAREVEIPRLEGLHRLLASAIVGKRGRLAPSEIRFLRSSTGWTGVAMAQHLGVTPEAVSRWENGKDTIGALADRLVRMVAAAQLGVEAPVDVLTELTDDAAPLALRVRFGHDGWHVVGAADPAEAWASAAPEDRAAVLEAIAPQHFDERRRPIAEAARAVLRGLEKEAASSSRAA
jgi:putative zinc finger/helix-turn-helix YgiT family protein